MTQGASSIGLCRQSPIAMLYRASTWICRTITTRWQEIVMVAGVVCAIVGAVVALFQSMPLLACTFLFFGAISAAGLAFMQQINAIRRLEKEILGNMHKENEKLKASNSALEKIKAELEKTAGELNQTKGELETTVHQLKAENAKQKIDFDESNQKLGAQVLELTTSVASLSGLGEHLKDEVQEVGKNTEIAKKILSKIEPHVDKAQCVLQQIRTQFKTQDQTFNEHIIELKKFFRTATVQKCISNLFKLTNEITAKHEEHTKLLLEYANHKDAFGRERTLLEATRKELQRLHPLLQRDERDLRTGVDQLATQNQRLREGLDLLSCQLSPVVSQ